MSRLNLTLAETAKVLRNKAGSDWSATSFPGVSTDTRSIQPGELFVALEGENFDGHKFLDAAFEKGAAAAVVKKSSRAHKGRTLLRVDDTLQALGDLAAYVRNRSSAKVIALTGSNGKTTTKELLVRMISGKYKTLATKGNFNNLIGLPLTVFGLRDDHEVMILEMGMNVPGEIARLTEIAKPDVGLITNVSGAHLEGLGSIEGVAAAKGELYRGLNGSSTAAVNADDPLASGQAEAFHGPKVFFGFHKNAQVRAEKIGFSGLNGLGFDLVMPKGKARVNFRLLGRHNVANTLAAASAASILGVTPKSIARNLDGFEPFPGRLALHKLPGPVYLIDDSYNANPASMDASLRILASLKHSRGRLVAVLGDMLELGKAAKKAHEEVGRLAGDLKLDTVVAVGPESKILKREAKKAGVENLTWFEDSNRAGEYLINELRPFDRVLVKGSRGIKMERIVKRLMSGEGV